MKGRFCLALETTGAHLGLSLFELTPGGGRRKRTFYKERRGQQAEALVPEIQRLLTSSRCRSSDLALIAVDVGPGSFTGVRVGVATARALAQGLGRPLIGISSLEAMAWAGKRKKEEVRVAWMPALPGEVYFAIFRVGPRTFEVIHPPEWTTEKAYRARLAHLSAPPVVRETPPHPDAIAERACAQFRAGGADSFAFERTVPLYLQPSWAERELASRSRA